MMELGFFASLFQQFVALLSVFCIAPSSAQNIAAVNLGPPNSPTVQVAEYTSADAAAVARQQQPFIARVVQTQIDGLLSPRGGIGISLARTADGVTRSILDTPDALRRALDNNGLQALPGSLAAHGIDGVQNLEFNTIRVIDAMEALTLANLGLLPGGVVRPTPEVAELAARQDEFGAIGRALLAAPTFVLRTLQGGPEALPVVLSGLGRGFVQAAATDARAIVRAVSSATQAALALVPGARLPRLDEVTVAVREPVRAPGPVEYIVRLPIAVGVAGSALTRGGMRATTVMVTAVVTAVTDIAQAAFRPRQANEAEARALERPLTLPEAIAKAPVTLRAGAVSAGRELQRGVGNAQRGFTETLRGRNNQELERAGDLNNAVVNAGGENAIIAAGDNNVNAAKVDAVKPNRPRPVLGAVKAVTGTLKAVRNGIRTALGLPPRRSNAPQPEKAAEREAAPAS
jgi:hypothetical protein